VSADWERTSLQPSRHPSGVFKASPVMGYTTEGGGFANSNLVIADEESQEFDDLIFALKTGEEPTKHRCLTNEFKTGDLFILPHAGSKRNLTFLLTMCSAS